MKTMRETMYPVLVAGVCIHLAYNAMDFLTQATTEGTLLALVRVVSEVFLLWYLMGDKDTPPPPRLTPRFA